VEELIPDFPADYDKLARARCGVGGGQRGDRRPAESGALGYGGYPASEAAYGYFELVLVMKPDWPADTDPS